MSVCRLIQVLTKLPFQQSIVCWFHVFWTCQNLYHAPWAFGLTSDGGVLSPSPIRSWTAKCLLAMVVGPFRQTRIFRVRLFSFYLWMLWQHSTDAALLDRLQNQIRGNLGIQYPIWNSIKINLIIKTRSRWGSKVMQQRVYSLRLILLSKEVKNSCCFFRKCLETWLTIAMMGYCSSSSEILASSSSKL